MPEILQSFPDTVEGSLGSDDSWKRELATAIRSSQKLCASLGISPAEIGVDAEAEFPVLVPSSFHKRIERENPRDPLLLQVLAHRAEETAEGLKDPVEDLSFQKSAGLLQKYQNRALVISSGACAIHCRYCFRRHFPYQGLSLASQASNWLETISSDSSIEEVILSGGDPLTAVDDSLAEFVEGINRIPSVKRLRVHTRLPVVIPSRVCSGLTSWVKACRPACYFVLHFNHRNEIDDEVCRAMRELRQAGATLLNQTVLLRGVNDSEQCLVDLFKALVDTQVVPYYLHQLDPVRGAMHFEVSDAKAIELISACRSQLPGYAVPTLVREVPGEPNKSPIQLNL